MTSKILAFVCIAFLVAGVARAQRKAEAKVSSAPSKDQIAIVSQSQDSSPDGSFSAAYETANGIVFEESGELKAGAEPGAEIQVIKGSASWTDPSGEAVKLSWTADENGAVFEGDHLPTPPPTEALPPAIQRALEWIAANPSKESEESKK